MSESNFYKQFKNNWKPLYVNRIETSLLGNGFPDCHLVNNNKVDILVELKYMKKAFKHKKLVLESNSGVIKMSQIHWMLKYLGKNAYFLFKIDKMYYLFDKSKALILKDKIKWEDFCFESMIETSNLKIIVNYLKERK